MDPEVSALHPELQLRGSPSWLIPSTRQGLVALLGLLGGNRIRADSKPSTEIRVVDVHRCFPA
eukprot:7811901-Alexandrium_andersonii.AAC.1